MVMCMNLQNVLFIVTASSAAARSISIIYRQDAVESEREGKTAHNFSVETWNGERSQSSSPRKIPWIFGATHGERFCISVPGHGLMARFGRGTRKMLGP
jgi:hypothetical protein